MKILWVKSGGLVPLDTGGKIRSFHLLRELARIHTVDLFTFYAEHQPDSHANLQQFVHRVVCQPLPIAPPRSLADYAHYLQNLFSVRPYSMAKYCRPAVARKLRAWLHQEKYDLLLCDFLLTASVVPWELPGPKVIFTHNVEAQIWKRHYQVASNPLWRAISWREYKTMERVERRYLCLADLVLTVSENDRLAFERFLPASRLAVVPTGVDADYFQPGSEPEQPRTLVFTGSMDWMPNEDAMLYFVEQMLPQIQARMPGTELWVVGRRPTARLLSLAQRQPAVHVTGDVEDIRPHVRRAAVYVVPLRIGGGTRIKIFEAMALGKAVVSTTIGAEGLPVTHGANILLADKPAEFSESVVNLLQDAQRRHELGRAARQLVEKRYSWASVAVDLANTLERAAKEYEEKSLTRTI